jgi:L-asparaginase/Glu-tRNA(Gln) amidotransferase subunit D
MRTITILFVVAALSMPALAQVGVVPTFTVTTNDVEPSSIAIYRMGGTNKTRVAVRFAFTDTGAKRLEEFYRAHTIGQEVRYRIGSFEPVFRLDDRKIFRIQTFPGLPESESRALENGLRGRQ